MKVEGKAPQLSHSKYQSWTWGLRVHEDINRGSNVYTWILFQKII